MKRRALLGGTLSAVTLGTCKAQPATAIAQNAAIQTLPEPLVWPTVTKPQEGVRSFVGHADTVLDVIGRSDTELSPVSDTELSKEIENPVTRRITLPLRYEADFLDGAYKLGTLLTGRRRG